MNIFFEYIFIKKIDLYLLKKFTHNFFMFFFIILSALFLIEFVELLRRTAENPNVDSHYYVLYLAFLKISGSVSYVIPVLIYFTTMYSCWRLNRSREMVIIQNSGMSSYRILYPFILFSLILSLLYLLLNPFLSHGTNMYEKIDQQLFRGELSKSTLYKSGVWLRQGSDQNKIVIRASNYISDDSLFEDVTFYIFTKKNNFVERIDTEKAILKENYWQMTKATINRPNKRVVKIEEYTLTTNLSVKKIENSFLDPKSMSIWKLPSFIKLLKQSGFSSTKHEIYLYKTCILPIFLIGLVLLGGPFTMKFTKTIGKSAYLILIGTFLGFLIYALSEYIYNLGIANKLPTWLASMAPSFITIMMGVYFIIYFENEN